MKIDVVQCMVSDASETDAIAYWARLVGSITHNEAGDVVSFQARERGDEGPAVKPGSFTVNAAFIREGVALLVSGKVKVRRDIAAQFVGAEEDWNYDSEGIDCAIQAARFGELVYG